MCVLCIIFSMLQLFVFEVTLLGTICDHKCCFVCGSLDASGEDQVGKTVAIIVGSLAGLAVFVVVLSFLRKALGKYS